MKSFIVINPYFHDGMNFLTMLVCMYMYIYFKAGKV